MGLQVGNVCKIEDRPSDTRPTNVKDKTVAACILLSNTTCMAVAVDAEAVSECYKLKVVSKRTFSLPPSPKANSANRWKPSPPPPV
ncbi:hypothetical protein WN943_002917 [Citrus x changshan-huyou]